MSREITRAKRDWLEGEVAAWRRMGLLSAEQAQALMGLYESPEAAKSRQHSKGIFTLLVLAATFAGLGVMLHHSSDHSTGPDARRVQGRGYLLRAHRHPRRG